MKACWFCRYFYYSAGEPGYSEMTPGSDFEISCYKNKWEYKPHRTTQDEFGKILMTAEECPDYEKKG